MPYYHDLDAHSPSGKRATERLLSLRKALKEIPERMLDETLLLATWNIRDFDAPDYGDRMEEAIYYIAEIIARFDLVAIQEVNKDLTGLNRVMKVLGEHWKYVFSDTTEGRRGNDERMAFVYDSRKVDFGGLAGELVLPPIKQKDGTKKPARQLSRTPFVCGFKTGWIKFMLATVHIIWGADEKEPPERVNEIRQIVQFLKGRTEDETAWSRNLILLGDFNIFKPGDITFQELINAGFVIPPQIQRLPSSAARARHYDQIAFRVRKGHFIMTGKAGIFDYYKIVFRNNPDDEAIYIPNMMPGYETTKKGKPRSERSKKNYYKTYWRTHQMSDHLPMWVELKIDHSNQFLERKLCKV